MDLIGMGARRLRAQMKLTVLKCTGGKEWPKGDRIKLVRMAGTMSFHPQHPEYLILTGEFERVPITLVLGHDQFELEVVQGLDSPSLPFPPMF